MKAVILAGGHGTRLTEETSIRPKPMVEVGEHPILWHVMKIYSAHGIDDFVVCCGYKSEMIKDYFLGYAMRRADMTVDLARNKIELHSNCAERWRVTLVDTGQETMTGGRLKRVSEHIGDDTFCFTYGDGVSDIHIGELVAFHRSRGKMATLTAVQPPGRFGAFTLPPDGDLIAEFQEKPDGDGAWVNGGFFVLEPSAIDYIDNDTSVWEHEPMARLARDGELAAYRHKGFWQPMDTLRDKIVLDDLWRTKRAPWKVW